MSPFLRTRVCRAISVVTACAMMMTTVLSTVSVAYAAETVPLPPPVIASAPPAASLPPAKAAPTVVRELTERRSATATHYLMTDGTVRAEIAQSPVRFRDAAGAWRDIDTNLLPADGAGTVRTASTALASSFGVEEPDSSPVTLTGEGYSVGIDYLDGVEGAKLTLGNRVVYPNVGHDTDLAYEAKNDGIKETVLLSSADAPSRFRFALSLDGLEMRRDFSGSWGLYRPGEALPTLALAPLVVFDSGRDAAGDPAVCPDATMTVVPDGTMAYVTYEVPRSWLQDPARVFPVAVDPTLTLTSAGATYGDTFVSSAFPGTTYWSSDELKCGYYDSTTGHNRTYVRFDLSSVPQTAYVLDTNFKIHQFHQYYLSTATTTYLGSLKNSFSSGTTWNTQSSVVGQPGAKVDYIGSKSVTGREVDLNWDVDATVQHWLDGSVTNNGFMIYQSETSAENTTHWRKFRSGEYSVSADRPTLMVFYSDPGTAGSGVDQAVYSPGDAVVATARLNSGVPADINAIKLSVRGMSGQTPVSRGSLMWTKTAPGSGWVAAACSGSAGGYVSFDPSAPGADMLELIPAQCAAVINDTADTTQNYLAVTFVFKIASAWGDVQQNDLVITGYMDAHDGNDADSIWNSGERITDTNFGVSAAPTARIDGTAASGAWFIETDPDGDGVSTDRNDTNASGRGSVTLGWDPVSAATSYRVYLFDGNTYRQVAAPAGTTWSSSGAGLYPGDAAIAALASGYTGDPFTAGTGLDLRDDPSALYAKTSGTSVDAVPAYFFKVTGVNSGGESPLSSAATVTVQLADRTRKANEDVAHTIYDLGSVAGDGAQVELDSGVLTLSATDLAIDSFGPAAALTRTYRSDNTAESRFGAGWRFGFEQAVAVGASNSRIFTDEAGRTHRFLASGTDVWTAPHSMVATLTFDPAASTYALLFKGGSTLTFDSAGRLTKEADRRGDATTYAWSGSDLVSITAANAHAIILTSSGGRVTGATYATTSGTRQVEYPTRTRVLRHVSSTETAQIDYTYVSGRITSVSVNGFAPGGVTALWDFTYTGSRLSRLHLPHPASITERTIDISAVSGSAVTVSRPARVGLAASDSTVSEVYTFDPTGREISRTVPGETGVATTDHAPGGEVRRAVTAAGVVSEAVTDVRGNVLLTRDGAGHTTANTYSTSDDLVSSTDPRGALSTYTYTAAGDPLVERHQLNATEWAQTTLDYTGDDHGRVQSGTQAITATTSFVTTYRDYGDFMEAGTVTQVGVAVSATDTMPANRATHRTFDGFGQVLSETDPANVVVAQMTYDLSGRMLTETDAAGTVTHHTYDLLGSEIESSRTSGTAWTDWTRKTVDPTGLVLTEDGYVSIGGSPVVYRTVTHAYDGSGHELSSIASNEGTGKTAYDAKGEPETEWAPTAVSLTDTTKATVTDTDADGRERSSQVSTSAITTTDYVPGAEQVENVDPSDAAATHYDYDEAGNQTVVKSPDDGGGSVQAVIGYDLGGRQISSTDAAGDVVVTTYDLLGRAVSRSLGTAAGPRVATTTYNCLGWVIDSVDADGVKVSHIYDAVGRSLKDTVTMPGAPSAVTQHGYDSSGREITTIDPDGWITETSYDAFGRVTHRVEHQGAASAVHDVAVSYDAAGRTVETSDTVTGSRTTYDYAQSVAGVSHIVRTLGETTLTIELSAAGVELRRVFESGSGAAASSVDIAVTSRNNQSLPELWEYVSGAFDEMRLSGRDSVGRISVQMAIGSASYAYDSSSGRKTTDTVSGRTTDYTYTDEGRLASARTGTDPATLYSFSEAGDVTAAGGSTFVYERPGGHLASSTAAGVTTTYSFDERGRRTAQTSSAEAVTYTWSDGDRLTAYTLDRAPLGSIDVNASFTYDASGQRTGSVVTSGGVLTTTSYIYEGLQLARLTSTTGGVTTTISYVFDEQGAVQALSLKASDMTASYTLPIFTTDRGDVAHVADYDRTPVAAWTYDPFGRVLGSTVRSAPTVPLAVAQRIADLQPLRFAGYAYDTFSGLYYCSQRYFDPATAQFISRDPALSDAEESSYQYCGGDPVGKTDPSGLWTIPLSTHFLKSYWYRFLGRQWYGHLVWNFRVEGFGVADACDTNPDDRPLRAAIVGVTLAWGAMFSYGGVTIASLGLGGGPAKSAWGFLISAAGTALSSSISIKDPGAAYGVFRRKVIGLTRSSIQWEKRAGHYYQGTQRHRSSR